ncbi:heavy metal translocating P-type ATPase [Lactobacillus amylovorus]|uniref:heavy metal translocating P-type ATPase n=1 Tax=Lactobacillus amylovorus TaxID=1604 RepID=UPI0021A3B5C6|nr:heavy metal translocating P-type ATPase [Lactobacillus amylovorus]MCT3600975.1 heavy metal translocating P-type ATPase [Lactobacillus amylovorus]
MVKIQRFFIKYKRQILITITILLILAEIFQWVFKLTLLYQILMAVAGVIGVIPIILTAISSLKVKLISIDVLVSLAVIGAFTIGEFNEAAIVTWLFMLGEVLEDFTLKKTRSAVSDLVSMAPQTALVVQEDGSTEEEDVDFIDSGDQVVVKTGDQVPVDGKIISGSGNLDEASINGESRLVNKGVGDAVYAGTMLENGNLTVETTAAGEDTTFGKIIEVVEEAEDSKSHTEKLINRFAKYYTPLILIIALIVGVITRNFKLAITIMVLGCPGALVIGVPVSTVAGIGNGAKNGIIFKGSQVMDEMRKVDEIAFDKTGTLTIGHPEVSAVRVLNGDKAKIIKLAAAIEKKSNHPLANTIAKMDPFVIDAVVETVKGEGVIATYEQEKYFVGNLQLVEENTKKNAELEKIADDLSSQGDSIVVFSNRDQSLLTIFGIKDQLRPQAKKALLKLKKLGIKKLVMLSGDKQQTAEKIATELPLDEVHGEQLPSDKATFIKAEQQKGNKVAFIGDGINDGPALASANVAIAVGNGTDVAVDVSDIVLVKNDLKQVAYAFSLSKRTILNMNENIALALLTVLILFIGLFVGYIEMASGMLVHELSILVVILNGMRLLKNR